MKRAISLFIILFLFFLRSKAQNQQVILEKGTKINSSAIIARTEYIIDAATSLDSALVIIEGDNITVDFSQALLHSALDVTKPDRFRGVAVLIRNSKNVTVKNARIHGYKIAVRAENVENLTIENCDFSYNFRKQLNSNKDREDASDWMSYHHNDKDEWLHYGAGIYLRGCNGVYIHDNQITNGQCALLMTDCNDGRILNNNFFFNSGLGIGMYRCNSNEIMLNHLDFNIRGFSFGVYNRGQDSAGILVYEQSSKNVFAYNTSTHCGDGFFLWAGQTTMDSGKGGCNDNVIFGNDFSDASNNGIEATFSQNAFVNNRVERCDYGVWGGYSYNSVIGANQFADNKVAIAIEHGQNNHLLYNGFTDDKLAIKLWANKEQPKNWGYVKAKDTRCTNNFIEHNSFFGNARALEFTRCDSIIIDKNSFSNIGEIYKPDYASRMVNFYNIVDSVKQTEIERFIKAFDPLPSESRPEPSPYAGRQNIIITDWGPYNFQRPILWLDSIDHNGKMFFKILGPAGKWRMQRMQGVKLSRLNGLVPDTISATPLQGLNGEVRIDLQYFGGKVIDEFGEETEAGKSFDFSFRKFEMPIQWKINYYVMDTFNPVKYAGVFKNALKRGAVKSDSTKKLEFTWWNAPDKKLTEDHFALVADAAQDFPKGNYTFGITADDGVRFYIDNKLVMDEWDSSKYKFDDELHHEVTLSLEGTHKLRVEYYDQTGFATLMFTIQKQL